MIKPQINFCYFSFSRSESLQIVSIIDDKIILRGFDSGLKFATTEKQIEQAILTNKLIEHTKQNQYFNFLNSLKK